MKELFYIKNLSGNCALHHCKELKQYKQSLKNEVILLPTRFNNNFSYVIILFALLFFTIPSYSNSKFDYVVFQQEIIDIEASSYLGDNLPENANDNDPTTRWESEQQEDPQWIIFKLRTPKYIQELTIKWETASALSYNIELSKDGEHWILVAFVKDGTEGETRNIKFKPHSARYIKIYCKTRTTQWGYSIWEVDINPSALAESKIKIVNGSVSSDGPDSNGVEALFDNDLSTRWESEHGIDPAWVILELEKRQPVSALRILWETASAEEYRIEYMADNNRWEKIKSITDGTEAEERTIIFDKSITTDKIRIFCEKRTTEWGYSIFEVEVY